MSPTLTGIAACLASASATVAPTPAPLSAPAVDFEDAQDEPSDEQAKDSLANLQAADVAKAAAGPKVHIQSSRPVELFVVTGEATAMTANGAAYAVSYDRVCDDPCDVRVSTRPDYFIKGQGVTPSRRFRVRDEGDVTLDVRPGRPALRWLGGVSATAGITMLAIGATLLALDVGKNSTNTGLIAGGSVLTAGSIPLFIFGRTKVTQRR